MSKGYKRKTLRFWSRVISMLLVVALASESFLGSGNIVLAAQQETVGVAEEADSDNLEGVVEDSISTDNTENGEDVNTDELNILFEMEEKREQSGKHYRLSDGSIMATDYGMDIHYQKDGQWEDIDN